MHDFDEFNIGENDKPLREKFIAKMATLGLDAKEKYSEDFGRFGLNSLIYRFPDGEMFCVWPRNILSFSDMREYLLFHCEQLKSYVESVDFDAAKDLSNVNLYIAQGPFDGFVDFAAS